MGVGVDRESGGRVGESGKHGALSPVIIKNERVGNHFSGNHGDNQRDPNLTIPPQEPS